jgi:hypothetical protein
VLSDVILANGFGEDKCPNLKSPLSFCENCEALVERERVPVAVLLDEEEDEVVAEKATGELDLGVVEVVVIIRLLIVVHGNTI